MMISPHMSVSCLVFMEMIYSEDYTANTATDSPTDDHKDFDNEYDNQTLRNIVTMMMMTSLCHATV